VPRGCRRIEQLLPLCDRARGQNVGHDGLQHLPVLLPRRERCEAFVLGKVGPADCVAELDPEALEHESKHQVSVLRGVAAIRDHALMRGTHAHRGLAGEQVEFRQVVKHSCGIVGEISTRVRAEAVVT